MENDKWQKYLSASGRVATRANGESGPLEAIYYIPKDAKKVLDAGAGNCEWAKCIVKNGHDVIALDLYSDVELTHTEKGVDKMRGDLHDIPLDNEFVDAVYCAHTFEHVLAPYIVLMEFNRVLKNFGYAVFLNPHETQSWHNEKTHINLLNMQQMENLARKTGFELVFQNSHAGENSYIMVFKKMRSVAIP